ncbi:MAG: 50S ribosomal protein L10, partial [Caulobacterales bacterium]|nr:50S ribosomal protein L10 [Caulobacterales bacterium]
MERAQKAEAVESLKGLFADAGVLVVTHYSGLSVAEMTSLRAKLREANAELKVVKNRLAKIALKDTPNEGLSDLFAGPVAIAYSQDPVGATKAAVAYA